MNLKELRAEATRLEIPGRSKMGRGELESEIQRLMSSEQPGETGGPPVVVDGFGTPAEILPAILEQPAAADVNLTAQTKELIRQINPDATQAELEVFFYQCARTGLDPIARQIYLIRRDNRMVIQTGIDGFRVTAARSGLMAGSDDPVFDVELEGQISPPGPPASASVTVYRIAADGERYPYTATARWSEYAPADMDGRGSFMWRKMPHTMLGKCAEALALRKAFPSELSGLYTDVEMDQAGPADTTPRIETPIDSRHFCPDCEAAGKQIPVIDNRQRHESWVETEGGRKRPPAWSCSLRGKCAKGDAYGWGSWETGYFEDLESGAALQVGRPSMSGLFKITDTAKDAVRKWLFVQFTGNPDETKLFWTELLLHEPEWDERMDDLTEGQALELEVLMGHVLDQWSEES